MVPFFGYVYYHFAGSLAAGVKIEVFEINHQELSNVNSS
jgi:hypothetical protein